MNKSRFLTALLLLTPFAAAPAAVTSNPLGIAGDTNVFVSGNAYAPKGGQAQGSVVVGGNFSGVNYDVRLVKNTAQPGSPLPDNTSLYIGGNDTVAGNRGADAAVRANSGDIYIGGTYTKANLVAKNGSIYSKTFDLAPTVENLVKLSSELSQMDSVTISLNPKDVSVKIDLDQNTANGKELKVYTIDGTKISNLNNINFSGGSGEETIVVNVLGHTVDWGLSTNATDGKILWNFVDQPSGVKGDTTAQTLNVNKMFKGTILAPSADVNQNANINGTLIAKNWNILNKNATMMDNAFTGNITLVSAPEPAGLMTMGGFLGLALFSRRRSAARL